MMTNSEKILVDMIKTVTDGSMKADDRILDALEAIAKTTRETILTLNNKIVDLEERVARLENKVR